MDSIDVIAVIIAYNNPAELEIAINCILHQSYVVKRVVVIDNSNLELAKSNRLIVDKLSNAGEAIYYKKTSHNIGSAGGYELAMNIAHNLGCDFVWLNDQDGVPDKECLNSLIKAYYKIGKPAVYAPVIIDIDEEYELNSFRTMVNSFCNMVPRFESDSIIQRIDLAGTTGILIHDEIINQIGVYNSSAFFVGGEDIEYSLRVKKNGYNLWLIKNAIYKHPDLFKKYHEKNRLITKLPVSYKVRPRNLGFILQDNERNRKMCIGAAYINECYCREPYRHVNSFYSYIRTLVTKVFVHEIELGITFDCYRKGKALAKEHKASIKENTSNI